MASKKIKQWLIKKGLKDNGKYFINFIEEGIFNPDYKDYTAGRIEIWVDSYEFDVDEIRFFTKDSSFEEFRNKWDFKDVNAKQLDEIERVTKKLYQDKVS